MSDLESRVGALEANMETQEKRLNAMSLDLKSILETLNKMAGGKAALFGLLTILGTLAALCVAALTLWNKS